MKLRHEDIFLLIMKGAEPQAGNTQGAGSWIPFNFREQRQGEKETKAEKQRGLDGGETSRPEGKAQRGSGVGPAAAVMVVTGIWKCHSSLFCLGLR